MVLSSRPATPSVGVVPDDRGMIAAGDSLRRIFGGHLPVVAVDLPDVVDWLNACGVAAMPLAEVMSISDGAVLAVNAGLGTVRLAKASQPGVRKLNLLQSFNSGDSAAVRYTIAQFLASDPLVSVQNQADVAAAIKSSGGRIAFVSPPPGSATELNVQFRGPVGVSRLDDPIIKPGECLAAHHFFESGLSNLGTEEDSAFLVNGYCRASGMIASRHRELSAAPEPAEWTRYRDEIAEGGVELHIRDNQLVECLLGGRDIKSDIARWTGSYGLGVTECAVGTNPDVLSGIDWSMNSLMNEGAQGVHIGFGLLDGMHFDFICPGVALVAG